MKSVTRTIRIAVAVSATCALAARASVPSAEVEAAAAFAPPRLLKVSGALRQPPQRKGKRPSLPGHPDEIRRSWNCGAASMPQRIQ